MPESQSLNSTVPEETSSDVGYICLGCDFALWVPVFAFRTSTLGLYNDARFPGRCILALNKHYDHWEDVPSTELNELVLESQRAMRAITEVSGAARVNLAVLGNTDSHVHFHLIPRFPDTEPNPKKSPWDDPRPRSKMSDTRVQKLTQQLRHALQKQQ